MDAKQAVQILMEKQEAANKIEFVKVEDSYHRVLAKTIKSPINVPTHPRSAMDGYCINQQEGKRFKIIDTIFAGDISTIPVKEKTCMRIMTGAMIPNGYNAVIKQEDVTIEDDHITFNCDIEAFDNYCHTGEDIKQNSTIISKGTLLKSVHQGILSSVGIDQIPVYSKFKTSIIATGSELIQPGEPLICGKIYGSTLPILSSFIRSMGMVSLMNTFIEDNEEKIATAINDRINDVDIIITTGGVSVGEKDLIPVVMEKLGAELLYDHILIKPGTPSKAYYYKNKIILSFSGNPYAALINFEVTYWNICSKYYQSSDFLKKIYYGEVIDGSMKPSKLQRYVRAKAENGKVEVLSTHKSSVISNLVNSNALIIQPPNEIIEVGDQVAYFFLETSCN